MHTLETMFSVQRPLARAQSIPVIGPVVFSPVKAVVSVAQTIVGLVGAIFCGTLAVLAFTTNDHVAAWAAKETAFACGHLGMGLLGFGYSVGNMLTLGVLGFTVERIWLNPEKTIF